MPTQAMAITMEIGDAIPNLNAAQPSYTSGIGNLTNAPTAPGAIVVPQDPAGTSVTNTGRTKEAHAVYMTASLNILNVGTTPPAPGTLPVFKG